MEIVFFKFFLDKSILKSYLANERESNLNMSV